MHTILKKKRYVPVPVTVSLSTDYQDQGFGGYVLIATVILTLQSFFLVVKLLHFVDFPERGDGKVSIRFFVARTPARKELSELAFLHERILFLRQDAFSS